MRTLCSVILFCGLALTPFAAAEEGIRIYHDGPSGVRTRPTAMPLPSPKAPPKYSPVHDTAIYCRHYGYSYSTNSWGSPQSPLLYTYENQSFPPSTSYPVKIGFDSDWDDEHSRGHVQFDIDQLPDSIVALSAGLRLVTAYDTQWTHEWDSWADIPIVFRGMWRNQAVYTPHDGDASSWELYDDAGDGSADGTHNLTMDGTYNLDWPSSGTFYDLGTQAVSDLNASWPLGWFGIGFALPDESADRGVNLWGAGSLLHVTYKNNRSHPRLRNPSVLPSSGEAGITQFTYSVSYVDSMGYPADSAFVIIDGTQQISLSPAGDPVDCKFIAKTVLAAAGTHGYAFRFHNSFGRTVTLPAAGSFTGPGVSLHSGPYVRYLRSTVIDTGSLGNGDGVLNSGESARLRIWVKNCGSDSAASVIGTVSSGDPNLTLVIAADTFGTILSLDSAAQAGFTVAATASAPFNYTSSLVLRCRDKQSNEWASSILLPLNALFFDNADDSLAQNFTQSDSPWHRTQRSCYSPENSWWCGSESTGAYAANCNAALATAEFLIGRDQQLSFWHRYETELNYDSCFVETTTDGGAHWSIISTFNGNNLSWTKQACDLSAIAAGTPVQIRFRFKSDNSVNKQGWFVDDIRIGPAAAALSNGTASPTLGDTLTPFTYTVAYSSAANAAPTDSLVIIDGAPHPMARAGGAYLTGARYAYTTRLPLGNGHQFLFYFAADGQTLQCPSSGYGGGPWVGVPVFRDSFENGLSQWTTGHNYNSLDWSLTAANCHSATHCLTDSRDSAYRDSTDSWAQMLSAVDLSPYSWAKLGWFEKYWTESGYDYCHPEFSTDNGSTWSALIPQYSGLDTAWHERVADLGAFCGKAAPIKVRYRLTSDFSLHYDGWYVDDVQLIGGWPTGVNDRPPDECRMQNAEFKMEQNYPNPFTLFTAISYQLSAVSRIKLIVYNVAGQKVRTLADGVEPAGPHCVRWDGRDGAGKGVAAGVYFYQLRTSEKQIIRKLIVLK